MSRIYDIAGVLSIISAKEPRPVVADFSQSKPADSAVDIISEMPQLECFDLGEDLFLFGFNQDPYDIAYEAYWRTVFRS